MTIESLNDPHQELQYDSGVICIMVTDVADSLGITISLHSFALSMEPLVHAVVYCTSLDSVS